MTASASATSPVADCTSENATSAVLIGDRVGERSEGHGAHPDAAPGVHEGQHDRGEVALGAQHLGAVGKGRGDEADEHGRLRADRHAVDGDADESGEVRRDCSTAVQYASQGRGVRRCRR